MNTSIIVAVSKNNAIGKDNKLLYWLPNDLKRFKTLTAEHTIIMGRKTFESLPKGALPNRRNIVLSTQNNIQCPGCEVFHSLKDAIDHCNADEEIFIIGGESIYKQALEIANRLYITQIDNVADGADAFFPEIDFNIWKEKGREAHSTDEKHLYPYVFIDYQKE